MKKAIVCALAFWSIHFSFGQEAVSSARRTAPIEDEAPAGSSARPARGITLLGVLTTEIFGNFSGGSSRAAIWESLLRIGLEVDLEKLAGWQGWSLQIDALYPQGYGLTDAAVHDFNVLSNIDGYDSVRLYEAWVQNEFGGGRFSIRLGQILADAEFFVSDYSALFINSSFGAIPLISQNLSPPIFPVAAPGIRLRADPVDFCYAELAVFSGDVGEPNTTNKHGTRLSFSGEDGVLVFAEIGYKLNPKERQPAQASTCTAIPLAGTYKLGGYYDSKEFSDSGDGAPHRGDYSVYFIADQELWHPRESADRALSVFARVGGAPGDRNTVSFFADAGLHYKGVLASRAHDTLGLGFSYTGLSQALVDDSGRRIPSHHEAVLELTYQVALAEHVSLQPDLQIIFNPGAVRPASPAVVAGLRANLEF